MAILAGVRRLFPTLARNRRIVTLFVLLVILPGFIFSALMVRAISSEQMRRAYDTIAQQREVARVAEADLNAWLFSTGRDSARRYALLRFSAAGDEIVFPDFDLSLPAASSPRLRPFDAAPAGGALTAEVVRAHYYPRVQVFLRDSSAGRHSGAQYFLRLRALVIRAPGERDGYVIGVDPVVNHLDRRLAELCEGQSYTGQVWVAQAEQSAEPATDAYSLAGFPFFKITFTESTSPAMLSVRKNGFTYLMTTLISVAVLGSLFVHRAVSQEMRLAEIRKDFVAAVSHEFRSPLSSISLLAERLVSQRVTEPAQLAEYHRVIERDAKRLTSLVSRLLEFGRIEDGRAVYQLTVVDLVDVAREAIAPAPAGDATRVRFDGDRAPLWIRADRTAVSHAVQNLVENAAKYSQPATPIEVSCMEVDEACVVEVRDHGIGIAPAEHQRIFEKFYRSPAVATLGVEGVGVGLALVKHVMEAHGGTVSVHSSVGQGSTFRLSFPSVKP